MNVRARGLLLIGGALVLLVNAIVLAGVAWNRSGEPEATLRLSERELSLPGGWRYRYNREDSGLSLNLRWRVPTVGASKDATYQLDYGPYALVSWLDADKLAALGFDVRLPADEQAARRQRQSAREVWLALELDGPAQARAVEQAGEYLAAAERALAEHPNDPHHQDRAKTARRQFDSVRDEWSRLFAVDADRDADALRARYPDRERYAIVSGRVRPVWPYADARNQRTREWRGHIEAVNISSIHVPLAFRAAFEPMLDDAQTQRRARYEVTLAYGRRLEPWIVDVRPAAP